MKIKIKKEQIKVDPVKHFFKKRLSRLILIIKLIVVLIKNPPPSQKV